MMDLWLVVESLAWLIAAIWVAKVVEAARGLPKVANLLQEEFDRPPETAPRLTVIVPARNEAQDVAGCLESLLAQDYENLQVLAVNDRSTDETGAIMDRFAAMRPERLQVIHIAELPEGWLGKTHAMASAARAATDAEWLLFTDADVIFRVDALRRSLSYAMESGADHLVTLPTTIVKRWDEGALLGFLQTFGMWAARPWKVSDSTAKRDAIGIGAFNLVRRAAYEQVGGFEALRMAVIEDLGLARSVKQAGLAQRIAFGRGLVNVYWAAGAMGIVKVTTKNMFAAFRFSLLLALAGGTWLAAFYVAPAVGLFIPGLHLPSALVLIAMTVAYWLYGRISGISPWQVLLSPFAAILLIYALLRSMAVTLWQGGIVWRGTFYPLAELRRNAPPML